MKRKIALALATIMSMATLSVSALAVDGQAVNLQLNGTDVETDQPAVLYNGRTMVPVRVIAEAIGCEVEWDAETKAAIFSQDGVEATMVIGANELVYTDGETEASLEIDTPAMIMNGRTMVPVRFLSEYFGCEVEWDAETQTVNVVKETETDVVATPAAVEVETEDTTADVEDETATEEVSEEETEAIDAEADEDATEAEESEETTEEETETTTTEVE